MAKTQRGCPSCGSHRTWGLGSRGALHMCDSCGYRWEHCSDAYCRGYRVHVDTIEPMIKGCPECDVVNGGVRDVIVRQWPEAWRAVARKLEERDAASEKSEKSEKGTSPDPSDITPVTPRPA